MLAEATRPAIPRSFIEIGAMTGQEAGGGRAGMVSCHVHLGGG